MTDPQGFDWIFVQNPTNKGVKHTTWGGPSLDVNIVPFRTGDESTIQPTLDFGYWLVNRENQKFLAQYLMPVRQSALKEIATDPMVQWMFDYWVPNSRNRNPSGCTREEAEAFQTNWQKLWLPTDPTEVANSFKQQVDQFSCWVKA